MVRHKLISALIGCLLVFGCSSSTKNEAANYSDSLIVVADAEDIHCTKLNGSEQIFYLVKAEYPATGVLEEISKNLQNKGWEPLQEDYLNIGLPSSHVRGWTDFIDKKGNTVHQWLAQWQNKNGDILWCTLRYSYPRKANPNLKDLTISEIFIPSKVAKEEKQKILQTNIQEQNRK